MKIGIIVAMSKELAMILPLLSEATVETRGAVTLHRGRIGGNDIAVMQCGIGKVNAAIGAVSLIDAFSPDLVINTGVAAGAGDDIRVMDIVVADSLAHHDFWCIGEEWGHVPGCPRLFPAEVPAVAEKNGAKKGLIASGELFISRKEEIDSIRSHFPEVKAVDMESAAIAQACCLRQVPFMCLRVISDSPWTSHDNSSQYEDFWTEAPQKSFAAVSEILASL
ncbi:5'-methylthioadenosine/adenosylhomocysteine nucleosidase [Duncaniella sp.]|uniref:5'-methylthioadenosine/adenosylhomocysteine nucleosidase n=1 Tax=Duncaniella sp. TaxID=2518496 RepID=UPI0023C2A123|nr:5'-methylthioadenosine/adenosylhomocysteine nucleosidase [Duncaniella sp.]MDE5904753.1 5'-methylthioadenosine/adenosylhomocysteine nucleosidase [Duncaniella sp.]